MYASPWPEVPTTVVVPPQPQRTASDTGKHGMHKATGSPAGAKQPTPPALFDDLGALSDFLVPEFVTESSMAGSVVDFGLGDDLDAMAMLSDHATDINFDTLYGLDDKPAAPPTTPAAATPVPDRATHAVSPAPSRYSNDDDDGLSRYDSDAMLTDDDDGENDNHSDNDHSDSDNDLGSEADSGVDVPRTTAAAGRSPARPRRATRAPLRVRHTTPTPPGGRPGAGKVRRQAKMEVKTAALRPSIDMSDLQLPGLATKDINTIRKLFPGEVLQLDRDGFKQWRTEAQLRKLTPAEDEALRRIRRRLLGRTYAKRSRERQLEQENATVIECNKLRKENAFLRASVDKLQRKIRHMQQHKH